MLLFSIFPVINIIKYVYIIVDPYSEEYISAAYIT